MNSVIFFCDNDLTVSGFPRSTYSNRKSVKYLFLEFIKNQLGRSVEIGVDLFNNNIFFFFNLFFQGRPN